MRYPFPMHVGLLLRCLLVAAALLAATARGAAAMPEAATMLQAEALRGLPRSDAAVLARLPAGAPVTVLDSRPGWLRVSGAAGTGWVRMFGVARDAEATVATAAPDRGAGAVKPPAPGAAPDAAPPGARRHALILGIGRFGQPGIPPLPGVALDLLSAQDLARTMGVPAAQTTVLRDAELTLAGLVRALQQLVARVQPGDRVFLYYSGHGTRYLDSGRPGSPCVSSLLAHDGLPFTDSMLAEALQPLADRADKLFVFVDACFSGGTVRATRGAGPTAKFFARSGVVEQCGTPSNVVTRSLDASGAQRWAGRDNLVYLTAARDTEIAFEESATGGFATQAVRDCALRDARDLDGSGNLSVAEITRCAQQRIDARLAGNRDFRPHHLTLFGNRDFIPALATLAPAAPAVPAASLPVPLPAPPAPAAAAGPSTGPPAPGSAPAMAPAPAPSTAPAPATPPAAQAPAMAAPAAAEPVHPERTLRDIHAQRDARREVSVQVARNPLRIGDDTLELTIRSSHAGYLYLLYAGSDGRSVDMLFPNRLDGDNFVAARRSISLPRQGWTVQARGPAGVDRLLVLVSDLPRDFAGAGLRPTGLFSSVAATPQAVRDVTAAAALPAAASSAPCVQPAGCTGAYGAALLDIRERP